MHRGLETLLRPSELGLARTCVWAGERALCHVSPVGLGSRLGGSGIPWSPWGTLCLCFPMRSLGTDRACLGVLQGGATSAPGPAACRGFSALSLWPVAVDNPLLQMGK